MLKNTTTLLILYFLAFHSYASPTNTMNSMKDHSVASSPILVKPIKNFDVNKILNIRWYQILYMDTVPTFPQECTIMEFHQFCCPGRPFYFQQGWYDPEAGGQLWTNNFLLGEWINNNDAEFMILNVITGNLAVVVDRAWNYDWIILYFVTTYDEDWMVVLSKTQNNPVARARGLELANKYGLECKLDVPHGRQCNYNAISATFKQYR